LKLRADVTGDKLHFVSVADDGGEGRDDYRQQGEPADPTRAYAALLSAITGHAARLRFGSVLGSKARDLCFAHGVSHLRSIADAGGMPALMRANPVFASVIARPYSRDGHAKSLEPALLAPAGILIPML
jgi:hypothetical protein